MLAKVIKRKAPARKSAPQELLDYIDEPDKERADLLAQGRDSEAAQLITYAAREGVAGSGCLNIPGAQTKENAIATLDAIVTRARAKGLDASDPLYHVALNWQPGEQPTNEQAKAAALHTLKALGMQDAAGMYAIHRDTDHHHVHIAVCKYDPQDLHYLGPPKQDFLVLDKAMREIELAQGWAHSPGPYEVQDGRVVRAPKNRPREQNQEASIERVHGVPGIAAYCTPHLDKLCAAQSWPDLHRDLGALGLRIEPKHSGYIIAGEGLHGTQAVKASAVHRNLSGKALDARLGSYLPPSPRASARTDTLLDFQKRCAAGIEPTAPEKPSARDPAKRLQQRLERERERAALLERYAEHCRTAPKARRAQMAALKEQHKRERQALFAATSGTRRQRKAEHSAAFGDHIAALLTQSEDTKALAALKAAHGAQITSVKAIYSTNWRQFLEMRARLHDDEAAIAALRGIRYREQRKRSKNSPGFEGEDLQHPGQPGHPAGSIEGADAFSLATAHIEVSRDKSCVIYRDEAGAERVRDAGQRVDVVRSDDDEAMRAALGLVAKRYGNEVFITGDDAYKERAARECARRGIAVANIELTHIWHEERERKSNKAPDRSSER